MKEMKGMKIINEMKEGGDYLFIYRHLKAPSKKEQNGLKMVNVLNANGCEPFVARPL